MPEANIKTRDLHTSAVDFSFGELVNLHSDKEIIISPEYQRLFRWSDEQKSRLIESILVQLPIPPIFLIEDENGVLELIDGLQRVSSVIQFLDASKIEKDPLRLVGCDLAPEINGQTSDDLTLSDRLRIKRTPIRAIIIRKEGDPHIKYELFKRLNTGGSLLSAQEIRNCSSRMVGGGEEFYEFIKTLASTAAFKDAIARLPETDMEKRGDEELVLRFLAIKDYVDSYKGNVKEWLDSFMEAVLFRRIEFDYKSQTEIFESTFSAISKKLGGDAFARYRSGEAVGRLAPAYFEAVVGGYLRQSDAFDAKSPEQLKRALSELFGSDEFREVTGPGANSVHKLHSRIRLVEEKINSLD